MHDPQQELFTKLLLDLKSQGFDVYDGALPPDGTPYPFVYLGDVQQVDIEKKNAVTGNVHVTIHVWHNTPRKRGTVSSMLLSIKTLCRKIGHTDNFAWFVSNMNQQIFADTTTKTPLLHGVLEVEFKFS